MGKVDLINAFIKNVEGGDKICHETLIKSCFEVGFDCGLIDVFFKRGVFDLIESVLIEKMNYLSDNFEQKSTTFTAKVVDLSSSVFCDTFDSIFGKEVAKFLIKRPDFLTIVCVKISNFVMKECGDESIDFSFYTKRGILSSFFAKFLFNYATKNSFCECLIELEKDINSTKNIKKIKEKISLFANKFF